MVEGGLVMKLSIITPTWNRCCTLNQTLCSIESQQFQPYRHVIVDNLSEDQTTDIIQRYANRAKYEVIHIRERDKGIYDAMNKGARISGGDAFYFLNDDDCLLDPRSLCLLVKCLALVPQGIVFGDVLIKNTNTGSFRKRSHRQVNRLTLAEKSICQQATLYSRNALETVGLFDDKLKAAGDYDWMIRALVIKQLPAVYLRRMVAVFASGGISSNPDYATEFRSEMNSVLHRYYSQSLCERAQRYRRFWRKLPWGLRLSPSSERSDRLDVMTRMVVGNSLLHDPLAILDF
jgi:glycosyltransferase